MRIIIALRRYVQLLDCRGPVKDHLSYLNNLYLRIYCYYERVFYFYDRAALRESLENEERERD